MAQSFAVDVLLLEEEYHARSVSTGVVTAVCNVLGRVGLQNEFGRLDSENVRKELL